MNDSLCDIISALRRADVPRTSSLDGNGGDNPKGVNATDKLQTSTNNVNVGNLLHMADNLGKAVGTLVTVMTDDELGSTSDDDERQTSLK